MNRITKNNYLDFINISDMTKKELITQIRTAFKDVKLEDGVGLWEGQGLDYYVSQQEILKFRKKDERNNWDNISYGDIVHCQSSLSFFDAKGMRFCLPKFLIFDILGDEIYEKEGVHPPDVLFTLGYKLDEEYQQNRFSLFDNQQLQCIIDYLEYKLPQNDSDSELNGMIYKWKKKLKLK